MHLAQLAWVQSTPTSAFSGRRGPARLISQRRWRSRLPEGHRVAFATAQQWIDRLEAAQHSNSLDEELRRLERYGLLVVDEIGYLPLERQAANLLFALVARRYERGSIIVTPTAASRPGARSSGQMVAAALIDRLVHHAQIVTLKGKSYRLKDRGGRASRPIRLRAYGPPPDRQVPLVHFSVPESGAFSVPVDSSIAAEQTFRAIGRRLGRNVSTISREVGGVAGRRSYRATKAEDRASLLACRPKRSKLSCSPRLRRAVVGMLKKRFSPQQISARLKLENPDDPEMRISPETIYQSLYVQSRGRFRKDLTRYLRTGRSKRKPRSSSGAGRGKIAEMVMISERPAEAEDRAIPGHWEGT